MIAILEFLLLLCGTAATTGLAVAATQGAIESARGPEQVIRDAASVWAETNAALGMWIAAVVALAVARACALRRGSASIDVPLLLPSLVTVVGLGVAVQAGYGDPVHYAQVPGANAARSAAVAIASAALIVGSPFNPVDLLKVRAGWLLGGILVTYAALMLFGQAPPGSDQQIALGPIQPLDFIKVALAVWFGLFLGHRADKLRWQREGRGWLRWPRPGILGPAVLILVFCAIALAVLNDLGPASVLSGLFLVAVFAVTRSHGWALFATAILGSLLGLAIWRPPLLGDTFGVRVAMWLDPWENGLPRLQEVAEAHWSLASGGLWGQGPGHALTSLRYGHNDLVLAQLGEDLGLVGLCAWIGLMAVLILHGPFLARRLRTAERQLVALGIVTVLALQSATIFAGVFALGPLTGIVTPFLAKGGSALVAYVVGVALLARQAEDGQRQVPERALSEIDASAGELAILGVLLFGTMAAVAGWRTTVNTSDVSVRPALVRLEDGRYRLHHNPRLLDMAHQLRRGNILDRNGKGLAATDAKGVRAYPLGAALGTLLGAVPDGTYREKWMLETALNETLRGWPSLPKPMQLWVATDDRRLLGVGPAPNDSAAQAELLELTRPDLSRFEPLLHVRRSSREATLQDWAADVPSRSVRLTLDASLQQSVADIVRKAASKGRAAAAAVIDITTGHVLARAQWPDFDPAAPFDRAFCAASTTKKLLASEVALLPVEEQRRGWHRCPYDAWTDKTGIGGVYQAGSVFKLYTALTAARKGLVSEGAPSFECADIDADGPLMTRPGWRKPIHDASGDPMHGHVDLVEGLAVSCNVFFAQLGLELGEAGMSELADLGVTIGSRRFAPGKNGSRDLGLTGFGQGAAATHVVGAARLAAAIGAGGVYRTCDPDLRLDAPCQDIDLVSQPGGVAPILAGMRAVMETHGTGSRLTEPEGIRVYGKTGTAEADRFVGERAEGVGNRPGYHSWFVAIAEPDSEASDAPSAQGRIAVAVVVPRGGYGASAAGPAAMEIIAAARDLKLLQPLP